MSDPYVQQPQYTGPPPAQRPKKRGTLIGLAVLALITGFIGVASHLARQSDPDTAAVGDCVAREGSGVRVVECADPASAFTVVGKVPGKTQVQFSVGSGRICDPFPKAESAYWKGEEGGTG